MPYQYKRMSIKVGSNVLAAVNGQLNETVIAQLVEQIVNLADAGVEIILISSGAVASGRSTVSISEKTNPVSARQLLSSVGQVKLINTYARYFEKHNRQVAQVLVTKEDFRTRTHYLNMKNCLQILLQNKIIPIVNENDVVSITELMFTDNDELAGLVTNMINADALLILSNIDGVYSGDPGDPGSQLISEIKGNEIDFAGIIANKKSQFGRGGMITKCNTAAKIAASGVHVFIGNGSMPQVITRIASGESAGTHFIPDKKQKSGVKKWIAHSSGFTKGKVYINQGATQALMSNKATSLLPIGIVRLSGDFRKGDLLEILNEQEEIIGWGVAQYGLEKAKEKIGEHKQKPLIHYDHLYLK